jgi:hypothetical protein
MAKTAKPTPPMSGAIITGRTRRALPETQDNQPKETVIPGQRQGASPLNKNPEVAARVAEWLERKNKKRAK